MHVNIVIQHMNTLFAVLNTWLLTLFCRNSLCILFQKSNISAVCCGLGFLFFFSPPQAEANYLILTILPSTKHSYFILINLKAGSYCSNLFPKYLYLLYSHTVRNCIRSIEFFLSKTGTKQNENSYYHLVCQVKKKKKKT